MLLLNKNADKDDDGGDSDDDATAAAAASGGGGGDDEDEDGDGRLAVVGRPFLILKRSLKRWCWLITSLLATTCFFKCTRLRLYDETGRSIAGDLDRCVVDDDDLGAVDSERAEAEADMARADFD